MATRAKAVAVVDPQLQALSAKVDHMANKQSDYSTVLQAVQIDLHHVVKTMDTLAVVAKEQAAISTKMSQHGESIDRAFRTMQDHRSELATAITKLSDTLDRDREGAKSIGDTVTGYKAQLRLLYIIGGIVVVLVTTLASMTKSGVDKDIAGNRELITKNANDTEVLEAKWDRLRVTDQLTTSEMDRRISRLEAKLDGIDE